MEKADHYVVFIEVAHVFNIFFERRSAKIQDFYEIHQLFL